MSDSTSSPRKDIKITNVNSDVHRQLTNISKNMSIDMSQLLKPHLHTIVESYPEKLRKPAKD